MSHAYSETDRVIALAGIFQGAGLVADIANKGLCHAQAEQASINSLFVFDASSTEAVFGGLDDLRYGLQTLLTQLEKPQQRDMQIAQYVVSLIQLADKARKNIKRLSALGDALQVLHTNRTNFDLPEQETNQQLANIYQQHVSVMEPKIMVKGKPLYLENTDHVARIRSLLLAGFRSAVLWRQCHGKKIQFLLGRKKIARITQKLLDA